jgi:hypothetical protein
MLREVLPGCKETKGLREASSPGLTYPPPSFFILEPQILMLTVIIKGET